MEKKELEKIVEEVSEHLGIRREIIIEEIEWTKSYIENEEEAVAEALRSIYMIPGSVHPRYWRR